jgi:hypothetical protein
LTTADGTGVVLRVSSPSNLGLEPVSQVDASFDAWFDDVAVDVNPIGCER